MGSWWLPGSGCSLSGALYCVHVPRVLYPAVVFERLEERPRGLVAILRFFRQRRLEEGIEGRWEIWTVRAGRRDWISDMFDERVKQVHPKVRGLAGEHLEQDAGQ